MDPAGEHFLVWSRYGWYLVGVTAIALLALPIPLPAKITRGKPKASHRWEEIEYACWYEGSFWQRGGNGAHVMVRLIPASGCG